MTPPTVAIVIPARYQSSRYPGKPLASVTGFTGISKPLIQRSYEAALTVHGAASVHIATDSEEIRAVAEGFGADVILTSSSCENGTARCAAAISQRPDIDADIIVNWQGDALLTPSYFIEALIAHLRRAPNAMVATPAIRCGREHYAKLVAEDRAGRVGGTSVVFGERGQALYFSKRLIPYLSAEKQAEAFPFAFLHIGVYAYRREALLRYNNLAISAIEELEGLEQLRFLHHQIPVDVVEVQAPDWEIWELNNPSDLAPIENALKIMGAE
ncbi:MAG: 3-deoxy-manno-octulosonate cytidylyltransferase [Sphingorhabdus sp.]|nr:3-deoxy-manno-octulosonate cytidylyltransferase [Sphingorhabdus sp.]MBP7951896.1 3-deoxy-manno-octulosonate cytidylyltransferase [Sphingorhabdus sp.]